jgi:hypothetical protein
MSVGGIGFVAQQRPSKYMSFPCGISRTSPRIACASVSHEDRRPEMGTHAARPAHTVINIATRIVLLETGDNFMICNPRFHRRHDAERPGECDEVVVHKV